MMAANMAQISTLLLLCPLRLRPQMVVRGYQVYQAFYGCVECFGSQYHCKAQEDDKPFGACYFQPDACNGYGDDGCAMYPGIVFLT